MDTVLKENRVFPPSTSFAKEANVNEKAYQLAVDAATKDPVGFWVKQAKELQWEKPWKEALKWEPPFAKWFIEGKINASVNCLDRHLEKRGKKVALIWEAENGEVRKITYREMYERVSQLSHAMEKKLGLKAGDSVAVYMPVVPEAIYVMLACARIGVTHSVIFAGFAAHAIRDRVQDGQSKVIFTSDILYRRGQKLELQHTVKEALPECPTVKSVVVFHREGKKNVSAPWMDGETLMEGMPKEHKAAAFDAEHTLFTLYTSGTTGKPKGIVHSTGGYLCGVNATTRWIFDLKENDIYWCTADIGWITGHSYVVYGPLSNGATCLIYEGALNFPDAGRIWDLIDKHKVTILYTAPTAIRAFMRTGDAFPEKHKLDSLRLLGTVGEPINPEAWIWYSTKIGKNRCPIVDTWWQTETGAIMISPVPGVTSTKPGSATKPFPGIIADVVDESGKSCGPNEGGYLVIKHPWPSMLRTIFRNPDRYKAAYWEKFPGIYFTGDGAHRDEDGYFWIMGRVDDVLNVSGHRLGTMEIESALVSHPSVAEAAVVGRPDDLKGQAVYAYVTPKDGVKSDLKKLKDELKLHVTHEIGAIARPDEIRFTKTLPKTRSGKIMRRLLKDLAAGVEVKGDTTTLENPNLVEFID